MFEAQQRLTSLKASNPRVWGLDQHLATARELVSRADELFTQANTLLQLGNATGTNRLLKQAHSIVADLPGLSELLDLTQAQTSQAKALAESAAVELQEESLDAAWTHIRQSLQLDGGSETARTLADRISTQMKKATDASLRSRSSRRMAFAMVVGLVIALAVGLLALMGALQSSSKATKANREAAALQSQAYEDMAAERFDDAKTKFEMALSKLTNSDERSGEIRLQIEEALTSEAIVQGTAGLVILDGRWISREQRTAILGDRAELHVEINSLKTMIEALRDGKLEGVPDAAKPEDRSALITLLDRASEVAKSVDSDVDSAKLRLKKLVQECEDVLQRQGLRKHNGRWMTEADAFAQQQQDKGLVLYDGEWITPAVKENRIMTAKGLVRVGGQWMTPAERDRQQLARDRDEAADRSAREREERRLLVARERETVRKFLPQYVDLVREAKRIKTHFSEGVTFNAYNDRLASLVDAYSLVEDPESSLRKDAIAALEACKSVRTIWELKLRGTRSDEAVSGAMSFASLTIDRFIANYNALREN